MSNLPKAKHLTFSEMWQLYKTLEPNLSNTPEKYLVEEVKRILKSIDNESFKISLEVLYGKNFQVQRQPIEFAVMFLKGLKQNNLFAFSEEIRRIK